MVKDIQKEIFGWIIPRSKQWDSFEFNCFLEYLRVSKGFSKCICNAIKYGDCTIPFAMLQKLIPYISTTDDIISVHFGLFGSIKPLDLFQLPNEKTLNKLSQMKFKRVSFSFCSSAFFAIEMQILSFLRNIEKISFDSQANEVVNNHIMDCDVDTLSITNATNNMFTDSCKQKVKYLKMAIPKLENIDWIQQFPNIKRLDIHNNTLSVFNIPENFPHLERIKIRSTNGIDIWLPKYLKELNSHSELVITCIDDCQIDYLKIDLSTIINFPENLTVNRMKVRLSSDIPFADSDLLKQIKLMKSSPKLITLEEYNVISFRMS